MGGQFRKTPCMFYFQTRAKRDEQPYQLKVDVANNEFESGHNIFKGEDPITVGRKAIDQIADGYKWFGYKELTKQGGKS